MNFVIDAGNTLIKTAVYNPAGLVIVETHTDWSAEAITKTIDRHPEILSCLICATRDVPVWLPGLIQGRNIRYQELTHLLALPIEIGYETPETLGKDRIAAAAGAADLFPGHNVLAIDAGTALTIDLITDKGLFVGGNISPGMRMRFAALHQQTFSLPDIVPSEEVPLIGKNTREAILAGVVNGLIYEIDNSINSLKNKYNDLHLIMTGGDARYLSGRLKNTIFVEENLVLTGLNAILRNFSL
ncbi:MAG: type III pantothenate kinase [Bacteroidia bacterium]|nr:type III pantothenate kinase [Bacteroidia bacterium]